MGISLGHFLKEKNETLKLSFISGKKWVNREITVSEVNRPGLAIAGFFEYFQSERIQIIGMGEYTYLKKLTKTKRTSIFKKILSYKNIPCIVFTGNREPFREILQLGEKAGIPVLVTPLKTSQLMGSMIYHLENLMAPSIKMHGVLVRVYGLGVLIVGEAGVGKSECALELVKRDHMMVADDVVIISKILGGRLIGRGEELIKHHMEIRGLGIIDVKRLFGIGYILDETNIELVIKLVDWDKNVDYERIGIEERKTSILEVDIPEVVLPVGPGRNLAVLVEVASLNQRLKNLGHYSAKEFNKRLIRKIAQNK